MNTPNSGTAVVTIKAATKADHGTNIGWHPSFAGQAVFRSGANTLFGVSTDYLFLDGQGRTTKTSGYGIKLDSSTCTGPLCWNLSLSGRSNITVRYVEIRGAGDAGTDTHLDENIRIFGRTYPGAAGVTSPCNIFTFTIRATTRF